MDEVKNAISKLDLQINKSKFLSRILKNLESNSEDYESFINEGYEKKVIMLGYQLMHIYVRLKQCYNNNCMDI